MAAVKLTLEREVAGQTAVSGNGHCGIEGLCWFFGHTVSQYGAVVTDASVTRAVFIHKRLNYALAWSPTEHSIFGMRVLPLPAQCPENNAEYRLLVADGLAGEVRTAAAGGVVLVPYLPGHDAGFGMGFRIYTYAVTGILSANEIVRRYNEEFAGKAANCRPYTLVSLVEAGISRQALAAQPQHRH